MRVVIESPYAGEVERNVDYAKLCVRDSLGRGEYPIASHLLFTQEGLLDDENESERILGIRAGLAWHEVADLIVFYIDYGYSQGMKEARKHAESKNLKVEERKIF